MGLLRVPYKEYFIEASDCDRLSLIDPAQDGGDTRFGKEIFRTSLKSIGNFSGTWGNGNRWLILRMKIRCGLHLFRHHLYPLV